MKYILYMDESGNTGNPKFDGIKWNWERQPYFALGSIALQYDKADDINDKLVTIFKSYDKDLGVIKELKSTNSYRFKKEITTKIISLFINHNAMFYIDIVNKKFNIIKYINEYLIYPYYINYDTEIYDAEILRHEKNNMATFLYNNLDETILSNFINLCSSPINEEVPNNILQLSKKINDSVNNKRIKMQSVLVQERMLNYKKYGLEIENLIPIRDYTNKGSEMSLLPQIDSFLNIVTSFSTLKLKSNDELFIYHDKQEQFDMALKNWNDKMKNEFGLSNIKDIKFLDSKKNAIIQSVDFITGLVMNVYSTSVQNRFLTKNDREYRKILKPIFENCNVVSSIYEQTKFFADLNLRPISTQRPRLRL